MTTITNVPRSEIKIGNSATYTKTCTEDDVKLFAVVSGDVNPIHLDAEFAATTK